MRYPSINDRCKDILALGNLIWLYKVSQAWRRWIVLQSQANLFKYTVRTREDGQASQKNENEYNSYEFERMLGSGDACKSLSKMVNNEIQRPVQGAGFGTLLPKEKDDEESVVTFIKQRTKK